MRFGDQSIHYTTESIILLLYTKIIDYKEILESNCHVNVELSVSNFAKHLKHQMSSNKTKVNMASDADDFNKNIENVSKR